MNGNMTKTNEIGQTIAAQIGNAAFCMIGARDILATAEGLQFKVGSNPRRISAIQVELDPSDTYTLRFWKGRGVNMVEVSAVSFVYADSLRATITAETGLYTSL